MKFSFVLPLLILSATGCTSIGAQRMGIDRSDYSMRLLQNNKEQLLLNIVAIRYGDAPAFLEVNSVISQYTREGSVHADFGIHPAPDDADGTAGANVLLRETPTITYAPLSGERFSRSMLSPIPPASLLAMMEAGWSAEYLLRLSARSINGVRSGSHDPLFAGGADPQFPLIVKAIGRLQRSGGIALHIERDEKSHFTARAVLSRSPSDVDRADLEFIKRALNLPGDAKELAIRFGAAQPAPGQLAIGSRSMFEILTEMAQGVELPVKDRDGRVTDGQTGVAGADAAGEPPLVRIHCGPDRPADPHVAIRYRGSWFWIDGTDSESKRMFLITQILLSLNDSSTANNNAPLVTIPTG
ncbi:hypothetical protein [Novosphingobium sp. PhB165]|uniref:hypothetical protein n=1 Tax=Novosphingobium sp. PhB165 TaxID=2485105 RepID=UPI001043A34A|nr:hypothetical protein [Novosphingobium sp. PhB165]